MLPHPQIRDNVFRAQGNYELCTDVLGVGLDPRTSSSTMHSRGLEVDTARADVLVRGEPWHPRSWEIEEGLARKW